jgi:hypothetical protein
VSEGGISHQLAGKTIAEVWRNGSVLLIRCTDGCDITLGWRDEAGNPLKGEPVILGVGRHIMARKPAAPLAHKREARLT